MAAEAGVSIGAHPGFPDRAGFGRREMSIEPRDITDLVLYQIGAMSAIAKAEGASLRHVKPHGALYNMSARREDIAEAIVRATASFDAADRTQRATASSTASTPRMFKYVSC